MIRKSLQVLAILLALSSPVMAQTAPLTVPLTKPSATDKKVGKVDLSRFPVYALVQINYVDNAGNPTGDYYNVSIPQSAGDDPAHPSASVVTFLNAIMSSAAGETGTLSRWCHRVGFRAALKPHGDLNQ